MRTASILTAIVDGGQRTILPNVRPHPDVDCWDKDVGNLYSMHRRDEESPMNVYGGVAEKQLKQHP